MATSDRIKISNVRLSYPNLYETEKYGSGKEDTGKWSATLLIPKDREDTMEKLRALGLVVAEEVFGAGKVPKKIWDTDKCALRDGDKEEADEYQDHWSLKATSNKRLLLTDRARDQVTVDDGADPYNGIFYPGCYVTAIVSLWCADSYRHIRANLHAVQFVKDGERLGSGEGGPKVEDLMGELDALDDDVDV